MVVLKMKTHQWKNSFKKYQDVVMWICKILMNGCTDDPEFNMNADEIVQSVLYDFNNTPFLEEIEEPEEKISFNTAYGVIQMRTFY